MVEETLLILQENLFDHLLELGDPESRWMFSVLVLIQHREVRDHEEIRKFSEYGNFSTLPAEIRDSNMVLLLSTVFLLVSHCL